MLRLALHEMRTPLTSVQLNAQLVERSLTKLGLDKECRLVAMIVSSARKLDALTQELSDVARLRSGAAKLELRTQDLSRLVTEILARRSGELDVGRIRVALPAEPLPIAVDAGRFERILIDLLAIALGQDTDRTGIDLRLNATNDKVYLTFSAASGASGGARAAFSDESLGLGVLVARFLVECHGGELEVSAGATNALVLRLWLPKG